MGILATIKQLVPFSIYAVGIFFFLMGLIGKGQWALLLVTFLIPLRNIIDKVQEFPLGTKFIDILIIGALVSWFITSMKERKSFFAPSPLNVMIFILVIFTLISLMCGSNYLTGSFAFSISDERVKDWKNFCLMPLLFFITLNHIKERVWIERMLLAMAFAMFLMAYYTATQIGQYTSLLSREKINGTFVFLGPNEVAAFFNEYTMILIAIFFCLKEKWLKWSLLGMIYINLFCIVFLYSRGAYAGAFLGMTFLFLIKNKKLLIPLFIAAVLWQVVLPEKAVERIKGTKNIYGQLDESSERRILIWQQGMKLFEDNPVMGIGYGVFRYLGLDLGDTHNIYVKILVEQGLMGMTIFLIVLIIIFRMGFVLYKKGEDDLSQGMGLGLMACVIVLIVNNCFGDRWAYLELSAYLWIFAGLVARLNLTYQKPEVKLHTPKKNQRFKTK